MKTGYSSSSGRVFAMRGTGNQRKSGVSRRRARLPAFALMLALGMAMLSTPALAVDGCKVLLCLAAPNWRNVRECVPTIEQLMRDLRHGRPFPVCDMTGNNNNARHDWAQAPAFCPPQYTRKVFMENSFEFSCEYEGAITTVVNGALFTRTWWRDGGDTVTEFSAAAKATLRQWDPKFDNDFAAWLAIQPPPPPPDLP